MPGRAAARLWVRRPSALLLGAPAGGRGESWASQAAPGRIPALPSSQAAGAQESLLAALTLFPPPESEGLTALWEAVESSEPPHWRQAPRRGV